jgi:hypothetical protein
MNGWLSKLENSEIGESSSNGHNIVISATVRGRAFVL